MTTLIHDTRIVDGTASFAREAMSLLIDGGRIAWVGPAADAPREADERIDGCGRTLLPGLIDCHAHVMMGSGGDLTIWSERDEVRALLRGIANLRRCLEAGVTAVRDLGWRSPSVVDLALAVERGEITGPEIVAAARFIAPIGGYGAGLAREVATPEEARAAVAEQVQHGARVIKAIASPVPARAGERPVSDSFGVEALRAVAEVAHASGLRVTVHAHGLAGARDAVEAGVDCVEHGYRLDPPTIARMAERGIWLVPTMVAMEASQAPGLAPGVPEDTSRRARERWEASVAAVQAARRAGVRVATGTDSFAIVPIESLRREVRLLVEAGGYPPLDALHAATGGAAELLGIADHTGRISEGYTADLLLVQGDLTSDPACLGRIEAVWRRGVRMC